MAKRKPRISKRQQMVQEWLPLYELAEQVKALAPWQWMQEQDIFGVQDPGTGEIGFVSVMGMAGEHLCIGVYLGVNALHQFLALEEIGEGLAPWDMGQYLMTIPQMQASFENQDMVEKEDAGIMRKLKLNYSGRNGFPLFRSIHPGCPPILLDMERIPFLRHILEQTLAVAPRFKEDTSLLYPGDDGNVERYLLRVPQEQDGVLVWADEIHPIPGPSLQPISFVTNTETEEALKEVPRVGNAAEVDLFMMLAPVHEKRLLRPFFPFVLLIVDADSGQVLSHEMMTPLPTIEDMYAQIPQTVMELFLRNNFLPHEINTQTQLVTAVLTKVFADLDVPVVEQPFLPMVTEAKVALFMQFSGGDGFEE